MSTAGATPVSRWFGSHGAPWAGSVFTDRDLADFQACGKDPDAAARELRVLRRGAEPLALLRPCGPGDGVVRLSSEERQAAAKRYVEHAWSKQISKFIAAAGAASRMFQMFDTGEQEALRALRGRLPDLAFYPALEAALRRRGLDPQHIASQGDWQPIADCLLGKDGLGLGNLPKGMIPFHAYPGGARTALEEHVAESLGYAVGYGNLVHIHAVVSPAHESMVAAHLQAAADRFRAANIQIKTDTSVQSDSTQTVALDSRGDVLRGPGGRVVLRPAGHGALLSNLNSVDADLVFIRTVDNVLPAAFQEFVSFHKRVLGGVLLEIEAEIHECLSHLSTGPADGQYIRRGAEILEGRLSTPLPADWPTQPAEERRRFLIHRLNRPLRVCAMVPNNGKPGGAPVWIRTPAGERLRIADAPEVDLGCERQSEIWGSAPYFNPSDLICSVRDFRGNPFDLRRYQARDEWYVLDRFHHGEPIRALERSGLWNGGMAGWNTVFVETPAETLRPVKTLLELLDLPELPVA
jgi:hypothetical protein